MCLLLMCWMMEQQGLRDNLTAAMSKSKRGVERIISHPNKPVNEQGKHGLCPSRAIMCNPFLPLGLRILAQFSSRTDLCGEMVTKMKRKNSSNGDV